MTNLYTFKEEDYIKQRKYVKHDISYTTKFSLSQSKYSYRTPYESLDGLFCRYYSFQGYIEEKYDMTELIDFLNLIRDKINDTARVKDKEYDIILEKTEEYLDGGEHLNILYPVVLIYETREEFTLRKEKNMLNAKKSKETKSKGISEKEKLKIQSQIEEYEKSIQKLKSKLSR